MVDPTGFALVECPSFLGHGMAAAGFPPRLRNLALTSIGLPVFLRLGWRL